MNVLFLKRILADYHEDNGGDYRNRADDYHDKTEYGKTFSRLRKIEQIKLKELFVGNEFKSLAFCLKLRIY